MRTLVVRRILESWVTEQIKYFPELFIEDFGLGESMYKKLGIDDPPSRLRNSYIQDLFNVESFTIFFNHYVKTDKLADFMEELNRDTMHRFMQFLISTSKRPLSVEEKIKMVRKFKRKPLFANQVDEYIQEADFVYMQFAGGCISGSSSPTKECK